MMKSLAFAVISLVVAIDVDLFAQTPFYQGKTIRIIVGYQPGDNHDQYARTYARFMGKHIPGNPTFVVQNMPGAGSMIAANHVYTMTKPDGLTLGSFGGALIMAQITGRKEVQFDWPKYGWIGTPYRAGHLLFMRSATIRRAVRPPASAAPVTMYRVCSKMRWD
jgi:tripartite-type tricarboxylate transporter receptor subunit TctC